MAASSERNAEIRAASVRSPRRTHSGVSPQNMSRAEKVKIAQRMRAQGDTVYVIAAALGVNRSSASAYLTDPDLSKERARKASYGGTCVVCGKRTDGSNGRAKAPRYCADHAHENPEYLANITKWPQARIIESMHWWAKKYGKPPASPDWNPLACRTKLHDEERALRAEREIGLGNVPWFTSVFVHFGSWNAALVAAGYEPRAPHGGGGNSQYRRQSTPITHCLRGHEYTPENTYIVPSSGKRICRACDAIRTRRYRDRLRGKVAA